MGVLTITAIGDAAFARGILVLGVSFLYLGSRPHSSTRTDTRRRRGWFGLALHIFLWTVPLIHVVSALDILEPNEPSYSGLVVPCLLLSVLSWLLWQRIENTWLSPRFLPSATIAAVLTLTGVFGAAANGVPVRFSEDAQAYIHAVDSSLVKPTCPVRQEGPLAGLPVCEVGAKGPPSVLVWGDDHLSALQPGVSEAARRAGVSALIVASDDCIPLGGLQTLRSEEAADAGRPCDQQTAQVLQALPHLGTIRQVTLVADWVRYTGRTDATYIPRGAVRLGPMDGSPINADRQIDYVATAAARMADALAERGIRLSVLRQAPAQPGFDAETAARAAAPGYWLYRSGRPLSVSIHKDDAQRRHSDVDTIFRQIAATGKLRYLDTWPRFCSRQTCGVRGGLSSDYLTSTHLSPSGALALSPLLAEDFDRAWTHSPIRGSFES
nr:SGNH hydrolase domain-containing protein [Marivita sp. GX14005]